MQNNIVSTPIRCHLNGCEETHPDGVVGVVVRGRNELDGRKSGLVVGAVPLVVIKHTTTIALEISYL
jgi:hypothetical protein